MKAFTVGLISSLTNCLFQCQEKSASTICVSIFNIPHHQSLHHPALHYPVVLTYLTTFPLKIIVRNNFVNKKKCRFFSFELLIFTKLHVSRKYLERVEIGGSWKLFASNLSTNYTFKHETQQFKQVYNTLIG